MIYNRMLGAFQNAHNVDEKTTMMIIPLEPPPHDLINNSVSHGSQSVSHLPLYGLLGGTAPAHYYYTLTYWCTNFIIQIIFHIVHERPSYVKDFAPMQISSRQDEIV